ncbi:MAG: Uma2 family endonuclease [Acidobacteria bacterium]|nr:Uma2 family endonuclease [Acidobacteriota bacterium]
MISPAEYIKLEEDTGERFEYLNGEVFAMSVGAFPHNQITARLVQRIWFPGCETLGSSQRIVVLETGLETYPDVSVFRGEALLAGTLGMALANPVVLIEVFSRSTEAYDRGQKFAHYRRIASLQEYVLVAQDEVRVECFRRGEKGTWVLTECTEASAALSLESLSISIPVSAIYDGVKLEAGGAR